MYVGKEDLKGLPESVISTAAETAKEQDRKANGLSQHRDQVFSRFFTYSENRELRKTDL